MFKDASNIFLKEKSNPFMRPLLDRTRPWPPPLKTDTLDKDLQLGREKGGGGGMQEGEISSRLDTSSCPSRSTGHHS